MRGFYYEVAHNCNPFRVTKALFKRSFRKFPEQLSKLGYIKNKIAPKCNFYLLMKRMFCSKKTRDVLFKSVKDHLSTTACKFSLLILS